MKYELTHTLRLEFNTAENRCNKCNNKGHFANNCNINNKSKNLYNCTKCHSNDNYDYQCNIDNHIYLEKFNNKNDIETDIKNKEDLLQNIKKKQSIVDKYKYIEIYDTEEKIEISNKLIDYITVCESKIFKEIYIKIHMLYITIEDNLKDHYDDIKVIPKDSNIVTIYDEQYDNFDRCWTVDNIIAIQIFREMHEQKLNDILPNDIPKDKIIPVLEERIKQLNNKLLEIKN